MAATTNGLDKMRKHMRTREQAVRDGGRAAAKYVASQMVEPTRQNMPRQQALDADTVALRASGDRTVLVDSGKLRDSAYPSVVQSRKDPNQLFAEVRFRGRHTQAQQSISGSAKRVGTTRHAIKIRQTKSGGLRRSITNDQLAFIQMSGINPAKHHVFGDASRGAGVPSRPFGKLSPEIYRRFGAAAVNEFLRKPQRELDASRMVRVAFRVLRDVVEVVHAVGGAA